MSAAKPSISIFFLTWMAWLCLGPRAIADDVTAPVRGTITVDGKPLAAARIFFVLADDQFVGAKVKDDGTYKVDRVPVGRHTVSIEFKGARAAYSNESVLRVEVKNGENVLDFALTSK
jgi:hypothetical protein